MFFSFLKMFCWASIILLHPIPIWNFQSLEIISPEWKQRQNWLLLHGSSVGQTIQWKWGKKKKATTSFSTHETMKRMPLLLSLRSSCCFLIITALQRSRGKKTWYTQQCKKKMEGSSFYYHFRQNCIMFFGGVRNNPRPLICMQRGI